MESTIYVDMYTDRDYEGGFPWSIHIIRATTPTIHARFHEKESDGVGYKAVDLTDQVVKIVCRRLPDADGMVTKMLLNAGVRFPLTGYMGRFGTQREVSRGLGLNDVVIDESMTLVGTGSTGEATYTMTQTDTDRLGSFLCSFRLQDAADDETTRIVLGITGMVIQQGAEAYLSLND